MPRLDLFDSIKRKEKLHRSKNSDRESGAALVWVAGSLAVLLAMSAFAVDLGWIYLNRTRLQAAADAAALAGVVNLPGFPDEAEADAATAARANNFPIGSATSMATHISGDNRFQVTLTTDVDTFFLPVVGINSMQVSRRATAEYIKPVALGSPSNQFGGAGQGFWAAINGRYTEIQQGDPYASQCITHQSSSAGCVGPTNPLYRPGGYYYAVEVGPGSSGLNVQIYDGGHYLVGSGSPGRAGTSDPDDYSWRWNWPSGQRGVNMTINLFAPDQTPLDPRDNSDLRCTKTFGTFTGNPSGSERAAGHWDQWTGNNNCRVNGSITEGIWVLQIPSPLYEGNNNFAIRATVDSGPTPKVYGLLDMSIYVNFQGGLAQPYLAEVRPEHAGRTLEVDIFDLGEFNGTGSLWFRDKNGTGSKPTCTWTSSNGESGSPGACDISISSQRFNEEWLYVKLDIPNDYTCNTSTNDCWWKIFIQAPTSVPTDRTTWSARITGDPVRLTE